MRGGVFRSVAKGRAETAQNFTGWHLTSYGTRWKRVLKQSMSNVCQAEGVC